MEEQERVEILERTTSQLLNLGFWAHQIGYRYLREAVLVACQNPEAVDSEPLLSVCAGAPDLFLHLHQQSEPACKADEPRSYCGGRLAAVVRTLEK